MVRDETNVKFFAVLAGAVASSVIDLSIAVKKSYRHRILCSSQQPLQCNDVQ